MATATTVSKSAKTKKPLSDMHQLQRAVKELQKSAADQLTLEVESQATFEFLTSQVKALKHAFDTLSDVLLHEVDSLRKETHRQLYELDADCVRQKEAQKEMNEEVMQLKRTVELWSMKERHWGKDNEMLKATHGRHVEWMQQLQRDMADMNERLHDTKMDFTCKLSSAEEEYTSLRLECEQHTAQAKEQLQQLSEDTERQTKLLEEQSRDRFEDLELVGEAINTLKAQQVRLYDQVEGHRDTCASNVQYLEKRIGRVEDANECQQAVARTMKEKHAAMEQEQWERMESITETLAVFAKALQVPPIKVEDT